ncbi:MAG: M28 family peptidase [Acidobacteria bacterium]|nr:M28 family peptidase [Acidobacteriota bacterium]
MTELPKELAAVHARWAPVEARVNEILENIRHSCADRLPGEGYNRANERQVERLITWLREEFPGRIYEVERGGSPADRQVHAERWRQARERRDAPCVVAERQRLSRWALRTTRWNFIFTVPGESSEVFLLVAHYDTWRGVGADDNTTGEEILKQYLLADLRAVARPRLTHVYFLAGSEECGLVGLLSQLLLAGALIAAIQCLQQRSWHLLAAALAVVPLASYRFGVSGSREYVRALTPEELGRLRAVVSVDSVGEGRMYIPRSTLGADFIRALIPFGHYDAFTDLLEEAAHLHGVKYNNYLAGGTTDHVSFLEVNNGLWFRLRHAARRAGRWLAGASHPEPRRIPASALVTMTPGKASPVVFGGKIHTPADVPERVYPEPLRDALLILDYVFHVIEGGARVREPRQLADSHYARLYEITSPRGGAPDYWLALKDALEPNRRNLNIVYRVDAGVGEASKQARVELREPVGWGVHARLRSEVADLCRERNRICRRVRLDRLVASQATQEFVFARRLTFADQLRRRYHFFAAWLARWMGRYTFITFFAAAFLIAYAVGQALQFGFARSFLFQEWFFRYQFVTVPGLLLFQLGAILYLMVRAIPCFIDNAYRHANRADNMSSLRRTASPALHSEAKGTKS